MKLERITYKNLFVAFSGGYIVFWNNKLQELLNIVIWRNKVLSTLRSIEKTPLDITHQIDWVRSFDLKKDYYFFVYEKFSPYIHMWDTSVNFNCIGYCGLDKVNKVNGTAEMSLLINPDYHKEGYGTEAVKMLLKYGFNKLKLQCIYIECYLTTNTWEGFWKKQGFKEEGRLRRRKFWKGKYYDSIIASITREEWEEMNNDKN